MCKVHSTGSKNGWQNSLVLILKNTLIRDSITFITVMIQYKRHSRYRYLESISFTKSTLVCKTFTSLCNRQSWANKQKITEKNSFHRSNSTIVSHSANCQRWFKLQDKLQACEHKLLSIKIEKVIQ